MNQQRSLSSWRRKHSLRGLRGNKNYRNLTGALRKSGTYNAMRKSKLATVNQQISRELRSLLVDSEKEKKSISRFGSRGLLLRKSNSTRDNGNSEFLRKRQRKIRMRSQRAKVRAANKTVENGNGFALQKTLVPGYKLKDVQVNIETLKINEDDRRRRRRPKSKRKPKKKLGGAGSDTSRSGTASDAEHRSNSRSEEESGSEETHIISDDSDECSYKSDDDDDVICLSPSGQLSSEHSNATKVHKFAINDRRGRVASSGHRQNPSASGENLGRPSVDCSAESSGSSSVGGMSAMDFFSIFSSLQNSYLQMKTDYEQQLHEKVRKPHMCLTLNFF